MEWHHQCGIERKPDTLISEYKIHSMMIIYWLNAFERFIWTQKSFSYACGLNEMSLHNNVWCEHIYTLPTSNSIVTYCPRRHHWFTVSNKSVKQNFACLWEGQKNATGRVIHTAIFVHYTRLHNFHGASFFFHVSGSWDEVIVSLTIWMDTTLLYSKTCLWYSNK